MILRRRPATLRVMKVRLAHRDTQVGTDLEGQGLTIVCTGGVQAGEAWQVVQLKVVPELLLERAFKVVREGVRRGVVCPVAQRRHPRAYRVDGFIHRDRADSRPPLGLVGLRRGPRHGRSDRVVGDREGERVGGCVVGELGQSRQERAGGIRRLVGRDAGRAAKALHRQDVGRIRGADVAVCTNRVKDNQRDGLRGNRDTCRWLDASDSPNREVDIPRAGVLDQEARAIDGFGVDGVPDLRQVGQNDPAAGCRCRQRVVVPIGGQVAVAVHTRPHRDADAADRQNGTRRAGRQSSGAGGLVKGIIPKG